MNKKLAVLVRTYGSTAQAARKNRGRNPSPFPVGFAAGGDRVDPNESTISSPEAPSTKVPAKSQPHKIGYKCILWYARICPSVSGYSQVYPATARAPCHGRPRGPGRVPGHPYPVAALTAPRPGPRQEGGMFKVERSSPDRYRWERFRLRLLEFNLDLAVLIAKTQITNISGPPGSGPKRPIF